MEVILFLQLDIYTCKLSPFIVYFCFVLLGIYHYKHLNPAQNTITLKSTQSRLTRDRYVKGVTFHHSAESRRIDKRLAHSKATSSALHQIDCPSLQRGRGLSPYLQGWHSFPRLCHRPTLPGGLHMYTLSNHPSTT